MAILGRHEILCTLA